MQSPAKTVISEFSRAGVSIRAIAAFLNVAPSTVSRWNKPGRGRADGTIPAMYHPSLLGLARRNGVKLSHSDFTEGRNGRAKTRC